MRSRRFHFQHQRKEINTSITTWYHKNLKLPWSLNVVNKWDTYTACWLNTTRIYLRQSIHRHDKRLCWKNTETRRRREYEYHRARLRRWESLRTQVIRIPDVVTKIICSSAWDPRRPWWSFVMSDVKQGIGWTMRISGTPALLLSFEVTATFTDLLPLHAPSASTGIPMWSGHRSLSSQVFGDSNLSFKNKAPVPWRALALIHRAGSFPFPALGCILVGPVFW